MSQFGRPNRTKTMFSQIDANRPTYARQKLGGIESSQSVVKHQTAAQNAQNDGVVNKQTEMVRAGQQGRDSVANLSGFVTADSIKTDGQMQLNGPKPVFQTAFTDGQVGQTRASIVGPSDPDVIMSNAPTQANGMFAPSNFVIGNPATPGGQNARSGYGLDAGVQADTIGSEIDNRNSQLEQGVITKADGTISRVGELNLGKELDTAYTGASATLDAYRDKMTKENLGQLADNSAFEDQQTQLAAVLADRESNIGKLSKLYGVGYDSGKYGALDSNILQAQFNDAQEQAGQNLEALDTAEKAGDQTRKSYLEKSKELGTSLNTVKNETQDRVTKIDGELSSLKIKLEKLKTDTSVEAGKAKASIAAQVNQLETARKTQVAQLENDLVGKRERNDLAKKLGISDKESQGLTANQAHAANGILNPNIDSFTAAKFRELLPPDLLRRIYRDNPGLEQKHDAQTVKIKAATNTDVAKTAASGGLNVLFDKSRSGKEKQSAIYKTYHKYAN